MPGPRSLPEPTHVPCHLAPHLSAAAGSFSAWNPDFLSLTCRPRRKGLRSGRLDHLADGRPLSSDPEFRGRTGEGRRPHGAGLDPA